MVSIAGPRRVALTASTCQGLLAPSHGGHLSGRAARGSVALRKMACRPAVGFIFVGSRPSTRAPVLVWPMPSRRLLFRWARNRRGHSQRLAARRLRRYPGVPIMKKCPDYRGSRLRTIRLGCSCPNGAGFATKVAITDMFEIQSSQLARIQWRPGRRVAWPRRALQHKSGLRVVPLKAQAIGCAGDSHIIDPSSACIRLRDQIESEVSRSCRSTTVSSAVSARDPTGNCSTVARWPVHKRVTSATCPSGNSRAS